MGYTTAANAGKLGVTFFDYVDIVGVTGSIPVTPTIMKAGNRKVPGLRHFWLTASKNPTMFMIHGSQPQQRGNRGSPLITRVTHAFRPLGIPHQMPLPTSSCHTRNLTISRQKRGLGLLSHPDVAWHRPVWCEPQPLESHNV